MFQIGVIDGLGILLLGVAFWSWMIWFAAGVLNHTIWQFNGFCVSVFLTAAGIQTIAGFG